MTFLANAYTKAALDGTGCADPDFWSDFDANLAAWVAIVNAHAANASQQITLLTRLANVTSSSLNGVTFSVGNATHGPLYSTIRAASATSIYRILGTGYTDDTSNGNHGTVTSSLGSINNASGASSGTAPVEVIIISDDTESAEYFFCNWRSTSDSYVTTFFLWKSSNNEWVLQIWDDTPNYSLGAPSFDGWWGGTNIAGTTALPSNGFPVVPIWSFYRDSSGSPTNNPYGTGYAWKPAVNRFGSVFVPSILSSYYYGHGADWVCVGYRFIFNGQGLV